MFHEQHGLAMALKQMGHRLLLGHRHLQRAQITQQVHIDRRSLAHNRMKTRVSPALLR